MLVFAKNPLCLIEKKLDVFRMVLKVEDKHSETIYGSIDVYVINGMDV